MATLIITVNANGIPNPLSGNLYKNAANGDNSVKWQSGGGTGSHTITGLPSGVFTVDPPSSITISPGNPSDTYTVKTGADQGNYTYSVGSAVPNGQPKIIINP